MNKIDWGLIKFYGAYYAVFFIFSAFLAIKWFGEGYIYIAASSCIGGLIGLKISEEYSEYKNKKKSVKSEAIIETFRTNAV